MLLAQFLLRHLVSSMTVFQDAFISYGRVDSREFAARLNQRLIAMGLEVWFDCNDIPIGVDYQKQIDNGIQRAQNFLFILSPHAVNSPYCRLEIEQALRFNKRIIPVLHVESISRETWQQRHPSGTDDDWAAYQSSGRHSCFANMHPAIRRLQWAMFREGVDDFETALTNLLGILQQHQDYVRQHTLFLDQALLWEQQQKQSTHLLIGEERQQAQTWLQQRFEDAQPPCIPTDLHCEFITESIKNAQNLMTQVFLAHADEDAAVADQVRRSLMRHGITVWLSQRDIATGTAFQTAINRGIEEADNIVYLLSPEGLASRYCQQELDYAVSLNKRLIPLLVKSVQPEQMPPILRGIQYIDLTDNISALDYQQDESDLLRILQQEADYVNQHKAFLAKALKWERQHQNPALLLRGYNLHHAEAWLKTAKQRESQLPTALQAAFIEESLRQPPAASLDVFVSYSRTDSDFARRLNEALQIQGKTTWFDQESIASGADFQQEIFRGIEQSDHFLFILSPNAVQSPYCAAEVEYAQQLNKRMVSVLYRQTDSAAIHPTLAAIQWIDFTQQSNFATNFERLVRTLDTDLEHLHAHTRLLTRAIEWSTRGRKDSLLLRGDDLDTAEDWLTQCFNKSPQPTELQVDYLKQSRIADEAHQQQVIATLQDAQQQASQRIRLGLIGMICFLTAGFVTSSLLLQRTLQSSAAEQQAKQELARVTEEKAVIEEQLTTTNIVRRTQAVQLRRTNRELATTQEALIEAQDILTADSEAKATSADKRLLEDFTPGAEAAAMARPSNLDPNFSRGQNLPVAGNSDSAPSPALPPLDNLTGSGTESDPLNEPWPAPLNSGGSYLYSLTGDLIAQLDENLPRFSPNGQQLVTASLANNGSSLLYNTAGQPLSRFIGHSPRFSPDGQHLVTTTENGNSYFYSLASQQGLPLMGNYPVFSPDGQRLMTYDSDQNLSFLYNLSGQLIAQFQGLRPAFSKTGQHIVTTSGNVSHLYQTDSEQPIATLAGHSPSFSPDGQQLAFTDPNANHSYLYDLTQGQQQQIEGRFPSFSPDGSWVIAIGRQEGQTYSYLFDRQGNQLATFQGRYWALSPGRQRLLTTVGDQSILYNLSGQPVARFAGSSPRFSPDGQLIITALNGDETGLYGLDGVAIAVLQGRHPRFGLRGTRLATYSRAGRTYLYDRSGQELAQFEGYAPTFSPNAQYLVTDTQSPER